MKLTEQEQREAMCTVILAYWANTSGNMVRGVAYRIQWVDVDSDRAKMECVIVGRMP